MFTIISYQEHPIPKGLSSDWVIAELDLLPGEPLSGEEVDPVADTAREETRQKSGRPQSWFPGWLQVAPWHHLQVALSTQFHSSGKLGDSCRGEVSNLNSGWTLTINIWFIGSGTRAIWSVDGTSYVPTSVLTVLVAMTHWTIDDTLLGVRFALVEVTFAAVSSNVFCKKCWGTARSMQPMRPGAQHVHG